MPAYNKVILVGHLTRDPQMSYMPSNAAVTEFGIAVNRTWKTDDGTKQEQVSFFDVKAFGKRAETINQYFTKGKPILVEGQLRQDRWEDKDGNKRNKVYVVMDTFTFIGGGKQDDNGRQSNEAPEPTASTADDGVPF